MPRCVKPIALAIAFAASFANAAESYPDKALRFVVPFPAGGGTDGLARILGAKLTEFWGQQVVIDNRAGAQGSVGTAVGAKSPPDGYTLTLAHSGSLAINPHLYSNPGYVTIMFTVPFPTVPHVNAGKLPPVTILATQRIEAMPEVPTAIEAGYPELSNVTEWYGVVVPSATPRDVVTRLNAAIVKALNSPDVLKRIASLGQYPQPTTPAEFAQIIKADYERWGKVVKAANLKVE
ncbi:MAG: Bug family tripartite tricarboxylate transporter substrate binding protein [Burkholderiales bacterium]